MGNMAENDIQPDISKNKRRPDVLRAKDIIPSRLTPEELEQLEGESQNQIPQFSLADDIMAEQRRQSGMRRKSPPTIDSLPPATIKIVPAEIKAPPRETIISSTVIIDSQSYTSTCDPVIADVVRRDIEKFCVVALR